MSVHLSVRNNSASLNESWWNVILEHFLENLSRNFKVFFNLTRTTCTSHKYLRTFMIISCWITLKIRSISDRNCRENQNTRFVFSTCFAKIVPLLYRVKKCGRSGETTDENIVGLLCFASWITKATHTHSEYVILNIFPRKQLFLESASTLHYTYIACLFLILCNKVQFINLYSHYHNYSLISRRVRIDAKSTYYILLVRQYTRMYQRGYHWKYFCVISYWDFYENQSRKSKFR